MTRYIPSKILNLLHYENLNCLILDRNNSFGLVPLIEFNNDSAKMVSPFDINITKSVLKIDYEDFILEIKNYFNEHYSELLNGPIIGVVLYETGFVIFSKGILDIYTHTVNYDDYIYSKKIDLGYCSSYKQRYRFSKDVSAYHYYTVVQNRIESSINW